MAGMSRARLMPGPIAIATITSPAVKDQVRAAPARERLGREMWPE